MNPYKTLDVRPYQLMCVICRIGRRGNQADKVAEILSAVRKNPLLPLRLRCNVDSCYRFQNPGRDEDSPGGELFNDKRDLDIIQKFGLAPGDTRPAIELFERVFERIKTCQGICGYETVTGKAWTGCERAASGDYEKGIAAGLQAVIPRRTPAEKAQVKKTTAKETLETKALKIRPHHLMCMACFYSRKKVFAPIAEDNLWEAIVAIQRNPDIPITLIAGCCMICPPCGHYNPETGLCIGGHGMALRDQKKDLDVLQKLGLEFGVTLPAREMYTRLFKTIYSTRQICGCGDGEVRGWEWTLCRDDCAAYRQTRRCGMDFIPGFPDGPKCPPPANMCRG